MVKRTRRGFTFIELVVVSAVLGILAAVSVVAWNAFVGTAREGEVSARLDRVVTIEQSLARDYGSYSAWPADLSEAGADVRFLNGRSSRGADQVSLAVGSGGSLAMAVKFGDRCIFRLVAPLSAGGGSITPAGIPSSATCTGQSALPGNEDAVTQGGPLGS